MDNVQSVHGFSGCCPWALSSPHRLPGLYPGCPWTMSWLSTESMDSVHWVHGQCPLNPWTLSSLAGLTGLCPWTHWTLFRVSMDIVLTVHWVHGKCPLSPWTMSREPTESMNFLQRGLNRPESPRPLPPDSQRPVVHVSHTIPNKFPINFPLMESKSKSGHVTVSHWVTKPYFWRYSCWPKLIHTPILVFSIQGMLVKSDVKKRI